ncbi:forkhead-associated domain-containing protein / FHA domain-containing protein [Tasmannia lanceolata]|uniref:forkhead-associated domain-containing protein / FHA domain-containing protein n=1 Tax=Tasmannia lanceolata TaxID=3420 RepID=UPI004063744E
MELQDSSKRQRGNFPLPCRKKRRIVTKSGFFYLRSLGSPMILSSTNSLCRLICLRSDRVYSIGRKKKLCEVVFEDRRVSKRHCQILFDGLKRKFFIVDGFFPSDSFHLDEIRRKFGYHSNFKVEGSLNGLFVNGFRLKRGVITEVSVGDEVSLVCGGGSDHDLVDRVGFIVERIVFTEEVTGESVIAMKKSLEDEVKIRCRESSDASNVLAFKDKRPFSDFTLCRLRHKQLITRASLLLCKYRRILQSVDPISYIRRCVNLDKQEGIMMLKNGSSIISRKDHFQDLVLRKMIEIPPSSDSVIDKDKNLDSQKLLCHFSLNAERRLASETIDIIKTGSIRLHAGTVLASENCSMVNLRKTIKLNMSKETQSVFFSSDPLQQKDCSKNPDKEALLKDKSMDHLMNSIDNIYQINGASHSKKDRGISYSSCGRKFFLNRLKFMDNGLPDQHTNVSLPELLYPVEGLLRIFVATFTSDVLWFLSYCEVPNLLPITIACHNTDRCWSANHDKRTSAPYSDYPNLVVVYPPFPDSIAFGKDRKKQGIACHHPKLLVLQRQDSIRIVVTSANLVSRQWNGVTNTVWWQDFPRQSTPDYSSLFTHRSSGETNEDSKPDFAAQLAGFMASLLADVPSQAHWILELTKYDFGGAVGHLVSSIPGLHMQNPPYSREPLSFLPAKQISCSQSIDVKFLGSVQASVVGLSHRFRTAADSHGTQLKTLAAFLGKCRENAYGMSQVLLKRNTNIPADANAVSVLVCDLDEYSEGDYVQLGFLPKSVAKWVAPLYDIGFFSFSGCIYPKEALAAALGGTNHTVQLILYVSQGRNFSEIPSLIQPDHIAAICSLLASIQRCVGLWRLQEVLCRYKWPESLETDFVYGASSIGTSINAQFLAAFSAAVGKKSSEFSESEESDPEWGRWNANHELRSPSVRIIFPTIERVKNGVCGIWPSRRMLSFSERTWQRLRTRGILHDAIPHPIDRVGYPMHVKVARRRFLSKTGSSSFGWLYCGSHNFSRAAWGNPISHSSDVNAPGAIASSVLGSRLHICNYELGIIFVVPPPDISKVVSKEKHLNLDDITLPFVVPAPKYQHNDRPATAQAMREALAEVAQLEKENSMVMEPVEELMDGGISDEEEEMIEPTDYVVEEKEEEKAYAETLWSQVDSSES